MDALILLVADDQFDAAIQLLYRESGTTIFLFALVLANAVTFDNVGTDV